MQAGGDRRGRRWRPRRGPRRPTSTSETLGGQGFTDGTFDGVSYLGSTRTSPSFSLTLEDGSTFLLLVYVDSDLTVCDFF